MEEQAQDNFWNKLLKFWPIIIAVVAVLWAVIEVHYLSEARITSLSAKDDHQVEKLNTIQAGIDLQFEQLDGRIDERFSHLEKRMDEKFYHVDKTIQFLDRRLEDLREDVKDLSRGD